MSRPIRIEEHDRKLIKKIREEEKNKYENIIKNIKKEEEKKSNQKIKKIKEECENKIKELKEYYEKKISKLDKHKDKKTFPELVKEKTGLDVPQSTQEQIDIVNIIARNAINLYMKNPNYKGRINEFGNYMEQYLKGNGKYKIKTPYKTGTTKKQDKGYPDRVAIDENNQQSFYIELKVASQKSVDGKSTLRSFYMTFGANSKVTKSIPHFLIALLHNNKKNENGFILLNENFEVIDLFNKSLICKTEWASNNRELYTKN